MKASCSLILTALVATAVLPVRATTHHDVAANAVEEVSLADKDHTWQGAGSANAQNFRLGDQATLKVTSVDASRNEVGIYVEIAGATRATLDFSAIGEVDFNMAGSIHTAPGSTLVIKGVSTLKFGHNTALGEWPVYYPCLDIGGSLEFQDAAGQAVDGKIVMMGQAVAWTLPTGFDHERNLEITAGMDLGVHHNVLGFGDTIDLGAGGLNCNLTIVDGDGSSIPATALVKVPAGRTLRFNAQFIQTDKVLTTLSNPTSTNRIELSGGTIRFDDRSTLNLYGTISGFGKMLDGWSNDSSLRNIRAQCDFTGDGVNVDFSSSQTRIGATDKGSISFFHLKDGSRFNAVTMNKGTFTIADRNPNLTLQAPDGKMMVYAADGWKMVDDGALDFTAFQAGAHARYVISGERCVVGGAADAQIDVEPGAHLSVSDPGTSRMAINVKKGAEATLMGFVSPLLWVDASADGTISNLWIKQGSPYNGASGMALAEQYAQTSAGAPVVSQWLDVRGTSAYKLWSDRYDQPIEANVNSYFPNTHPYLVKGGLNGRDYLSFVPTSYAVRYADSTSADVKGYMQRVFFYKSDYVFNPGTTSHCRQSINPRYVIMVFGAQNGGGKGLVGTSSGDANFLRDNGVNNPIYKETEANKNLKAWINGREVNPRAEKTLVNGWQVVTLEIGGLPISGLGWGNVDYDGNGYQNYAEVLFFDKDLTDVQRQSVEIYLAEKWGLKDDYSYPASRPVNVASLYGEGSVTVSDDGLTLGGAFKGTIDLNGKSVTIDGVALPPDASVVPTEGCTGWFDPDDIARLHTGNHAGKMPKARLSYLEDKLGTEVGRYVLDSDGLDRGAAVIRSAHGLGPERTWLDYANYEGTTAGVGNLTRMKQWTVAGQTRGSQVTMDVRTIMITMDSRRGGGQPFFDGSNVNTPGNYKARTQYRTENARQVASFVGNAYVDSPIYPAGTAAVLTQGQTFLNGILMDGSTSGFTGRPEILTVLPKDVYPLRSFGNLNNSECLSLVGDEKSAGEIEGEIILWNRALSEDERKDAEAYLSYKWLGLVREGYSALGDATVTGAGTLSAASVALLPKFDAGFAGTVKVTDADGFAFQLSTENRVTSVVKSVDLGGGTLDVSGDVAVTVSALGANPCAGEYKLVGWSETPTDVNWSLALVGFSDSRQGLCHLAVRTDGLYLIIDRSGMMLILR